MNIKKKFSKIKIYLTGYDSFQDIVINPSMLLVNFIKDHINIIKSIFKDRIDIITYDIYQVDVGFVRESHRVLMERMKNEAKEDKEDVLKMTIHFGVATIIKNPVLRIEKIGKNWIDDRKSSPSKIDYNYDKTSISTDIDCEDIVNHIKSFTELSYDAGDFLCNFVYFLSLEEFESKDDYMSQFIHLPSLKVLSTETAFSYFLIYLNELLRIYYGRTSIE
jgi:pyrrolidone-carboxylate peptidase